MLRGELGQLGGKRVHFENDTPTLSELFCDEQLPERSPSPIPMPSPVQIVSWGDPKTQWAEGTVGKWRVAFSYFRAWYEDNIDAITIVENDPRTDHQKFHELYIPIKIFHADSIEIQKKIQQKIDNRDFCFDMCLDLGLTHGIQMALSTSHWGIWPCVDRLATYCNQILALPPIPQVPATPPPQNEVQAPQGLHPQDSRE